jgi:hypothetical protein
MFGSDFFKIFHFVIEILRLIASVFGDESDQQGFDNHLSKDREALAKAADVTGKTKKTNT